uniref:Uncharacterized protein n=1 Tax=Rhizophora mucronata TaxID=61149 RepID=A0A2P2QIE7_RHIMU
MVMAPIVGLSVKDLFAFVSCPGRGFGKPTCFQSSADS